MTNQFAHLKNNPMQECYRGLVRIEFTDSLMRGYKT